MEREQRIRIQRAAQDARTLLEADFSGQLLQVFDIDVEQVRIAESAGAHLQADQRLVRRKLVATIEHRAAAIGDQREALLLSLREMAFTTLNRFVALKLMFCVNYAANNIFKPRQPLHETAVDQEARCELSSITTQPLKSWTSFKMAGTSFSS